jgi:hypothetical protein
MIQLLLNNGADLAIANVVGRTALDKAASAGNTDAAKRLIECRQGTQVDHAETLRRAAEHQGDSDVQELDWLVLSAQYGFAFA